MKNIDIYNLIDKIAPFNTAMSFDNVGLLIGAKETEIVKILICLDITDDVIDEVIKIGANLIISHHPVIFEPLKSVCGNSIVHRLINNNISAICCHTNLDLCDSIGVNRALADKLLVKDIFIPDTVPKNYEYFKFTLENEISTMDYAKHIKNCFPDCCLQFNKIDKSLKTFAMCSGAGSSCVEYFSDDIDAFITGEIKYNIWLEAQRKGIVIFALGHFASEVVFAPLLQKYLSENTINIDIQISKAEKDIIQTL